MLDEGILSMCRIVGQLFKDNLIGSQLWLFLTSMFATMTDFGSDSEGAAIYGNEVNKLLYYPFRFTLAA